MYSTNAHRPICSPDRLLILPFHKRGQSSFDKVASSQLWFDFLYSYLKWILTKSKETLFPHPFPESCHWQSWKCFWQSEQKERSSAPKKETDGTHLETMSGRRYGDQCSKSLTKYKIVICQNNEQKVWQLTGIICEKMKLFVKKVTWVNQIPNRSSLSSAV